MNTHLTAAWIESKHARKPNSAYLTAVARSPFCRADGDLRSYRRASSSQPDSLLASPTSAQAAPNSVPPSSAESLGHPVSKACRAAASAPLPARPDITTDPNGAKMTASSEGDVAVVMPEDVFCSASLVVDESEHLVLTLTATSQDAHDKDAHVSPAGDAAQLEGDFVGLLYGWLHVKLSSRHKC